MGGLPKWEYILHLFANSLHFAAIVLIFATRVEIGEFGVIYSTKFLSSSSFETVQFIAVNILPGAIVLGIIHILLIFDFGKQLWNTNRLKITCC